MKQRVLTVALLLTILLAAAILREGDAVRSVFSAGRNAPRTLVLDAGHGGHDGGAVSADGTSEQAINLSIARKTAALVGLFGVPTVLTRTDEGWVEYDPSQPILANKAVDIRARVRIAESQQNPIFLSIHLNKFSDPKYSGPQVFWSPNNGTSQGLAEDIQIRLNAGLKPERERQSKRAADSIYLMRTLTCPAALVECGFLSNAAETEKLKTEPYQGRIALCVMGGYLDYAQQAQ